VVRVVVKDVGDDYDDDGGEYFYLRKKILDLFGEKE